MRKVTILALAALFIFTSCNFGGRQLQGNGNITTREHKLEGIHGVDVSGAIEVIVSQGTVSSVKVETDDNLHEVIAVEVDGGILHVHTRNNINADPTRGIKVYVSTATMDFFSASGACNITSTNRLASEKDVKIDLSGASTVKLDIKAPAVNVGASGACHINLEGETKTLDIDGSGSTNIKAFNLMTETASVNMSGAGNAEVFASVKLNVDISGAADVHYKGNATVSAETSGAASVRKID